MKKILKLENLNQVPGLGLFNKYFITYKILTMEKRTRDIELI
jgi:hypothetical protein